MFPIIMTTGKAAMVTDFETPVRNDISDLAAFLNEIRLTWRPLDWPHRDRLRQVILEALYRFRAQQQPGRTAPEECPHDVSWLVDAPREELLHLLKIARFNEEQLRDRLSRTEAGAVAQQADTRAALARCGALLSRTRKTVPMDALRMAVYGEEAGR